MKTSKAALICFAFLGMALFAFSLAAPKDPPVVEVYLSGGQMILAFVSIMGVGFAIGRSTR